MLNDLLCFIIRLWREGRSAARLQCDAKTRGALTSVQASKKMIEILKNVKCNWDEVMFAPLQALQA